METNSKANVTRFDGLSEVYHSSRPSPPQTLKSLVCRYLGKDSNVIDLLVDLGYLLEITEIFRSCGTGLSSIFWENSAQSVIGIDPNEEMLQTAKISYKNSKNVIFQKGFSNSTGLKDECADIVTCSQSLHWMEPASTFAEVNRILKVGGIFVAFDCDWPPSVPNWKAEKLYSDFNDNICTLGASTKLYEGVIKYEKDQHLQRMKDSNQFSFVKEVTLHNEDIGTAQRFINLALSQGGVSTGPSLFTSHLAVRKHFSDEQIKLKEFSTEIQELLGSDPFPWIWSYRVRIGVK